MTPTQLYYLQINVACIMVLLVLFFSTLKSEKTPRNKIYKATLIATIFNCLFDMAAGLLRGQTFAGATTLIWISNILYNIAGLIVAMLWIFFAVQVIRDRSFLALTIPLTVVCMAVVVLNALTPLNGWIFTVDANNLYSRGPLIWINWAFMFPAMIGPLAAVPFAKISFNKKIAIILYPIPSLIAVGLQLCFYGVSLAQVGLTISSLLVFVILQASEMMERNIKIKIYDELANTDSLTGLPNRRAGNLKSESVKDKPWVGIVFADINGLKTANDKKGHREGDQLLIDFANFLTAYFSKEDVFRISGDEFMIVTTDEAPFAAKIEELLANNKDRAAIGYRVGPGSEFDELFKEAENYMYRNKSEFYKRKGNDRRRY